MVEFVAVGVVMVSVGVGCTECRQIIARGNFVLCIIKEGNPYLIRDDNGARLCCGEKRQIPCLFSSEEEAEAARETLVAEITERGDIAHLTLSSLEMIASPTLH